MNLTKKVAVIGGGVVGMAAALFLQENYTVTLFEREREPKPLGAGIMLQPSGLAILDKLGVAVRTGHHCAQPVMDAFCIPGTVRASLAIYNTKDDVDRLVEGVKKAKSMLS